MASYTPYFLFFPVVGEAPSSLKRNGSLFSLRLLFSYRKGVVVALELQHTFHHLLIALKKQPVQ